MRQLLQSLNDGSLRVVDVPSPRVRDGMVHVRNIASIVSPGTERMILELAQKNLAEKARARPDLVRKVLDKVQRDGIGAAYRAVTSKLNEPVPVGYACAGEVVAAGVDAEDFAPGSLVACAGAGYASHAEEVLVPRNLVVPVPAGVPPEQAAFATLGAIALQGVRITKPELGEEVAVLGLGLLGLLTVQLLKANGCRVYGADFNPARVALAKELGADDAWTLDRDDTKERFLDATRGYGIDAVVVCASSDTNAPMVLAGEIARDRGRVVVVGAVKTEYDRNVYYMKELEVRLSRSYGPGRYDPAYEERGYGYPRGYVRFTETENLRSFLDLVAAGRVRVAPLITHRFSFDRVLEAYEELMRKGTTSMGIVLCYPSTPTPLPRTMGTTPVSGVPRVSFVGAGAFARSVLLPAFRGKCALRYVATGRGFTARGVADRFGFVGTAEGSRAILEDRETDAVVIVTRHDSHASLVAQALRAGKHVFVEKPLAIDLAGLREVEAALDAVKDRVLHVGFNRRFAPMAEKARALRRESPNAATMLLRVNAGAVPAGHWTTDAGEGGGRLVGEGCHFVDLARFVIGSPIRSVHAAATQGTVHAHENFVATLSFEDGSVATILYTSIGNTILPKERFEVFAGGSTAVIDDFMRASWARGSKEKTERSLEKDKGHEAQVGRFLDAVRGRGPAPIPLDEILEVSRATLALAESIRTGARIDLRTFV
ncbi:MAG: bi-domain-containing oxidoreductase [Sandaracinaceae bacterium]